MQLIFGVDLYTELFRLLKILQGYLICMIAKNKLFTVLKQKFINYFNNILKNIMLM